VAERAAFAAGRPRLAVHGRNREHGTRDRKNDDDKNHDDTNRDDRYGNGKYSHSVKR
jgi:hypothetical protein